MADAIGTAITTPEAGPTAPEAQAAAVPDKFKNADGSLNTTALLASYTELEKRQSGTSEQPKEGEQPPKEGEQPPEGDKSKEQEAPTEVEKNVSEVLKAAGLDLGEFNTEYGKDGKLSDDSYAKLEAKGFSRATVDQFIKGVEATNGAVSADAQKSISEIKDVAGGDEGYQQMLAWAQASLSKEQIGEFNDAVSSGKAGIAKAAVQMLKQQFDASEGSDPALLRVGGKPSVDTFRSWSEMEAAMKDPRYGKDRAYTSDIEQKAIRSNIR